jgi:hypothetical protein
LSSRLMAAYGSRRSKAARTGETNSDVILRLAASGEAWAVEKAAGGRRLVRGRRASDGPAVAAGLFQVLELKCRSVYHLTIWPFDFLNSALLMKHQINRLASSRLFARMGTLGVP